MKTRAGRIRPVSCFPDLKAWPLYSLLALPGIRCSLAIRFKDCRNFQNGVPIAVRGRNAEQLLDLSEVTYRFHLSSIKAQYESVLNRDDLEQPIVLCRQTERKCRRMCES